MTPHAVAARALKALHALEWPGGHHDAQVVEAGRQ